MSFLWLHFLIVDITVLQIQTSVKKLRDKANQDATVVQQGLEKIQQEAVSANGHLATYIATADSSSIEDAALLNTKVSRMEETLQSW